MTTRGTPVNRLKNKYGKIYRRVGQNVGSKDSFDNYILGSASGQLHPSIDDLTVDTTLFIVRKDEFAPEEIVPWLGLGMFPTTAGTGVKLGWLDGEYGIYSVDTKQLKAAGVNPNTLNTADTRLQGWFSKEGYPGLICKAIGTLFTPSTLFMIEAHAWFTDEYDYNAFQRAQGNFASHIPGAGVQRLVLVSLKRDLTANVENGSTRSSAIQITPTHIQEVMRKNPPRAIPVAVYRLADGQTSVTEANKVWDARELLNTQIPPRHNWSAVVDPDVTDDSGSGYGIGSVWVNTDTPESFMCVDDSVGAAVWASITGGTGSDASGITALYLAF